MPGKRQLGALRASKERMRSNLNDRPIRARSGRPAILIPSRRAGRNTISRVPWTAPALESGSLKPPASARLIYQATLAAQSLFYSGVLLLGDCMVKHNRRVRVLNFAYVFSLMNAAALVGLFYFVMGKRNVWARGV
jgi:hypothetical protein